MKILGIETSCDETAVAVVEDGRIIHANVVRSQMEEHGLYGGVVPEIASRRHTEQIVAVTDQALCEAQTTLDRLDAIAVTYTPGLIGALLVGVNFAKGIALMTQKPLIPMHHIKGHIAANYLAHPDLRPPFLCLVISGGHSHIIEVLSYTAYRVVGRTRDDAVGESYDKIARSLGLPYPGGVHLDQAASKGDPSRYSLPRPSIPGFPYDFSFSGLKTAVLNQIHNATQKGERVNPADMAASFQEAVCDLIESRLMAAAAELCYDTIVLAGGVSANSGIRSRMERACVAAGKQLYVPPLSLCGDNAAMIAAGAYHEWQAGTVAGMDLNAVASMPIA